MRTVLQSDQALRIERSHELKVSLAKAIAGEMKDIWDRVRVPTVAEENCVRKVLEKSEHLSSPQNPGEHAEEITAALGSLCDLVPKLQGKASEEAQLDLLQGRMCQTSDMKRRKPDGDHYDWRVDFEFYIDQFKGTRVQASGAEDKKRLSAARSQGRKCQKAREVPWAAL